MDVRIDDSAMQLLVQKAVLDSLTPEKREALITEAIKQLLTRTNDRYDSRSSLQKAFDQAVFVVAGEIAREELGKDAAIRATIKKLMTDAFERMSTGEAYETLVEKVRDAMVSALSKDRY